MAYSITKQNNDMSYRYVELTVDKRSDILTLPVNKWSGGSVAFCIEDSSAWMLLVGDENTPKVWQEI